MGENMTSFRNIGSRTGWKPLGVKVASTVPVSPDLAAAWLEFDRPERPKRAHGALVAKATQRSAEVSNTPIKAPPARIGQVVTSRSRPVSTS